MSGPRPERLGWLYALVIVAVAAVGASAGRVFAANHLALVRPWAREYTLCRRRFGDWPEQIGAFERCLAPAERPRGWAMLAGAVIALLVVALLVLLVPVVDRWRLGAHRSRSAPDRARARFDALVAQAGLTGLRPELVVVNPPVRQPFTTVSAAGRPVVVLPVALALACDDPGRFDPVVQHELGHVRAGDARWVSAVRGLAWVLVPAFGAAVLPALLAWLASPQPLYVSGQFPLALRTVLLTLLTVVLSALLLRARELSCDRYAARTSGPALIRLLSGASGARTGALAGMFARHPSPRDRVAALTRPGDRPVAGSLAQGFAAGVVAMVAAGAATQVTAALFATANGWLGHVTGAVVTAAVLGGALGPGLIATAVRARETGGRAAWWRPVLGVAAGIAAGDLLSPVMSGLLMSAYPLQGAGLGWHAVATVLIALAAAAGVAACAALAELVAGARPGRGPRLLVVVAGAALTFSLVWLLAVVSTVLTDPDLVRRWLVFALAAPPSVFAMLPALLVPVAVLVLGRGFRWRAVLPTAGAAVLAGVLVSVLWTRGWPPSTTGEALRMLQGRWWVSALTGWVVLVAVAPRAGAARAVPVSWTAGVLVGAAQYGHALAGHRDDGWSELRQSVLTPLVWLIGLTALTLPVLLAARRREVTGARWVPVAGGLLTGALALLAMGPGIPGAYARVPPAVPVVAAGVPPGSVPPAAAPSPARDPGRVLSGDGASAVALAAGRVLPGYWQRAADPGPETGPKAAITPESCRALAHSDYLTPLAPGLAAGRAAVYETERTVPTVQSTLTVEVSSYRTPVSPAVFAAAERALRACPSYTATSNGSTVAFRASAGPAPRLGEQAFRVDSELSVPGVTGRTVFVMVRIGHNLLSVLMFATGEDIDEQHLTAALSAAVTALG